MKWMALAVPALVTGWILAGFAEPWPLLANLVRAASMALVPIAAGLCNHPIPPLRRGSRDIANHGLCLGHWGTARRVCRSCHVVDKPGSGIAIFWRA